MELDHSPLLDWVWHYFIEEDAKGRKSQGEGNNKSNPVILSGAQHNTVDGTMIYLMHGVFS